VQNRFAAIVERKARDVIEAYWGFRGRWNPARSLTNLTAHATHEYEHRFLIELIQNAYDAHPRDACDGLVHIRLDRDEGDHGVLYVANRGNPFQDSNFRAITEIAQSDKPPGAGIGNKGVGFRSVLQVCSWPEIYSADPEHSAGDATFTGFCFRFATPEDVLRLTGGDEEKCRAVLADVSPYFLPVPLAKQGAAVRAFARQGMATVIRLPLHKASSLEAVTAQIATLCSATAPVMLFLDRLQCLVIETCGRGQSAQRTELRREATRLAEVDGAHATRYEMVDLGRQGRFFVASRKVPQECLQRAIEESIQAEQLEPKWREWQDEAWVSAAARLEVEDEDTRLYTFLPMGPEEASPFAGHLHAPFATKLARIALSADIPLNSLLLDVGGELCTAAILYLREVDVEYSPKVALDLLTWRPPHHERLARGFTLLEHPLQDAEVIPIVPLPDGRAWGAMNEVCVWDDLSYAVLKSATLAAMAGAEILNPAPDSAQANRFEAFCNLFSIGIWPVDERAADWAERVAEHLQRQPFRAQEWDAFYGDLAKYPWDDAEVLIGRRLLIDDEGRLHRAGRGQDGEKTRDVMFFPPAKDRTEDDEQVDAGADLSIPTSLKKHICFLHPDLTWHRQESQTLKRTPARNFLQNEGLVSRYDTRGLLEHVSSILRHTESRQIRADALRWTFALQRAAGASRRLGLDKLRLHIPTTGGWVEATTAFFSSQWPATQGDSLEELIRHTKGVSSELTALEERLLLPPDTWPFRVDNLDAWTEFLQTIGVQDGLSPQPIGRPNHLTSQGRFLTPQGLGGALKLDPKDQALWRRAVLATGREPNHPYTPYRLEGHLWRLPGQSAYRTFPQRAKELYARLILHGLGWWEAEHLDVSIKRPNHPNSPDAFTWPTPLTAFLALEAWVPMSVPRDRHTEVFVPPQAAWHFSERIGDFPPPFAPLLPGDLRGAVDANRGLRTRLVRFGLKVWNDSTDAKSLVLHLGDLFRDGEIADAHIAPFKRAYEKAWTDLLLEELGDLFADAPDDAGRTTPASRKKPSSRRWRRLRRPCLCPPSRCSTCVARRRIWGRCATASVSATRTSTPP
jgi:hypothetical protein